MARSYDLSLLPSLQEQAAFFKQQSLDLVAFCEKEYTAFLAVVDLQNAKTDDAAIKESLEEIYEFAASRLEALQDMMRDEVMAVEEWQKSLSQVEKTRDTALWADVAEEMLENADFKTDANEFKAWATGEMASLKRGVDEVLADWRAAVEEGNATDLAQFIEALESMEDEEAEGECCEDDEDGDCCANDDTDDDCCGRQDPCCRVEADEDEEV
ncbi:MAG: hypothetical protein WCJ17_00845 [bacterium]